MKNIECAANRLYFYHVKQEHKSMSLLKMKNKMYFSFGAFPQFSHKCHSLIENQLDLNPEVE